MLQYLVVNPTGTRRHVIFKSSTQLMKTIISSGNDDYDFQITLIESGVNCVYDLLVKYVKQIDDSIFIKGKVVKNPKNLKLTNSSLFDIVLKQPPDECEYVNLAELFNSDDVLKNEYVKQSAATTQELNLTRNMLDKLFQPKHKEEFTEKMSTANHC